MVVRIPIDHVRTPKHANVLVVPFVGGKHSIDANLIVPVDVGRQCTVPNGLFKNVDGGCVGSGIKKSGAQVLEVGIWECLHPPIVGK